MFNRLKKIAKNFVPKSWRMVIGNCQWMRGGDLYTLSKRLKQNERNQFMLKGFLLKQQYPAIAADQGYKLAINKFEDKAYSQNGEDGMLLYIFSKIGVTNRCFVEFGIGDGKECNTANLALNFGWRGLLMDGSEEYVALAKQYYKNELYYKRQLGDRSSDVKIAHCFVTVDNINPVLRSNGMEGEIDLLSIDIDGNEYWIWKAITAINPRVVVIEYNASMGDKESITVKYDPEFDKHNFIPFNFYYGASLAALTKLAHSKGYILVGCDSTGLNAFFIRGDAAGGKFTPLPPAPLEISFLTGHGHPPASQAGKTVVTGFTNVSVEEAYFPIARRCRVMSREEQFERLSHYDFDHI